MIASWMPGGSERIPAKLEADRVPHAIQEARAELAAGDSKRALEWMRAASQAKDLASDLREQVQVLLEQAADGRIQELSKPGSDPDELADMLDLELPRQLAVSAGIQAAHGMKEEGDLFKAYREIKKVDVKFPLHHERVAAADLLTDIGLQLALEKSGFLGLFHSNGDAEEVLEYLILNYPAAERCDLAYATLAQLYEDDQRWMIAIERHQQLVLYHPKSPLRERSQAQIPHLRLIALKSPEFDRNEMLRARKEIEEWLRKFAGSPLEPDVRIDHADALQRLCDNDLIVAGFYDTVENGFGARYHAERAIEEARTAGDMERVRAAEHYLARLPPAELPPVAEPVSEAKP